jgi:hypothetical protein
MGNRIAPAGGRRISFALLAFALVASLVQVASTAPAQALPGDTGPAPIPGASTAGLDGGQWESKNQHRVWLNGSRWDAILPTASGWTIATGVIPTVPTGSPTYGPIVSAGDTDRPDIFWVANRLYVLMSGGTTTLYVYDYVGGVYTLDYSSTLSGMEPGEGRTAIYKVPGGNLWASMMDGDGLWVARSDDDGQTWEAPVKLQNPVAEGQTQLAHFGTQIGVAAAEDGDNSEVSKYLFYRIADNNISWDSVSFSTGTLTLGTLPINGDTVTIGTKVYTFRDAPLPNADGNVAIVPGNLAATQANLVAAISLDDNFEVTGYAALTKGNRFAIISDFAANVATITARDSGAPGTSVAIASSNVAKPVSGSTLTGGVSSWTPETMPLTSPSNLTHSDDEMSLVRATNGDLYVATETQRPGDGTTTQKRLDPQVVIFKRTAATDTWTQHVVKRDDQTSGTDRKRPVIAIVDNTIYVIAIAQDTTSSGYRTAPLGAPNFANNAFDAPWTPLFNTQFEFFRNNIVPRDPVTAAQKLPVLIDWAWDDCGDCPTVDVQDNTVWQTSLPNTGNQAPGASAGADKTVAASPVTDLAGTVTNDPLGGPVNWVWTQVSGPSSPVGVSFTNGTGSCAVAVCDLPTTAVYPGGLGTYVLRLTATETGTNALVNVDQVTVLVNAAVNTPPVLNVVKPTNGTTAALGSVVNFEATAIDPQDGDISAAIIWTSNLQGSIGFGGLFTKTNLSQGTHTITASVTDGQNPVIVQRTVTIGPAGPPPPPPPPGNPEKDEMFFYRSSDGAYRYYEMKTNGALGTQLSGGTGYSLGWSSITAVDLDGDGNDELFFYRSTDGAYRYYNMNTNGTLGAQLSGGTGYSLGWSSITAVNLNG